MKRNKSRIRRQAPVISQSGKGIIIECPFCHPPHQLRLDIPAPCGTILELKAVQSLYQDVTWALCGQTGGTLIKVGELYRHANECSPGKRLYTIPPKPSLGAAIFYRLPKWIQARHTRRTRKYAVQLSDQEGNVHGYAWDRI